MIMRTESEISDQKEAVKAFHSLNEMFNTEFEEQSGEDDSPLPDEPQELSTSDPQFKIGDWHPFQSTNDSEENPLDLQALFTEDENPEPIQVEKIPPNITRLTQTSLSIENQVKAHSSLVVTSEVQEERENNNQADCLDNGEDEEEIRLRESLYGKPANPQIQIESHSYHFLDATYGKEAVNCNTKDKNADPRAQRIMEEVDKLVDRIYELELSETRLESELSQVTEEAHRARENNRHVLEQIRRVERQNDELIAELRIRETTIEEQNRILEQKSGTLNQQTVLITELQNQVSELEASLSFYVRARLIRTVNELSNICNRQNWVPGFEYKLWEVAQNGEGEIGYGRLTPGEVHQLQEFSREANGWVIWDSEKGLIYIPLKDWRIHFQKWKVSSSGV